MRAPSQREFGRWRAQRLGGRQKRPGGAEAAGLDELRGAVAKRIRIGRDVNRIHAGAPFEP